ncbi:hypothetical protein EDC01DRAFT_634095 [Geopyxis carbonaria]|nr:hypothetical protein EDC01DRAFT_634095 [Geopyxis carbonaria]
MERIPTDPDYWRQKAAAGPPPVPVEFIPLHFERPKPCTTPVSISAMIKACDDAKRSTEEITSEEELIRELLALQIKGQEDKSKAKKGNSDRSNATARYTTSLLTEIDSNSAEAKFAPKKLFDHLHTFKEPDNTNPPGEALKLGTDHGDGAQLQAPADTVSIVQDIRQDTRSGPTTARSTSGNVSQEDSTLTGSPLPENIDDKQLHDTVSEEKKENLCPTVSCTKSYMEFGKSHIGKTDIALSQSPSNRGSTVQTRNEDVPTEQPAMPILSRNAAPKVLTLTVSHLLEIMEEKRLLETTLPNPMVEVSTVQEFCQDVQTEQTDIQSAALDFPQDVTTVILRPLPTNIAEDEVPETNLPRTISEVFPVRKTCEAIQTEQATSQIPVENIPQEA